MEKKLTTKIAVAASALALAGVGIAGPAMAASSTDTGSSSSTAPSFGKAHKGGKGHGMRGGVNVAPQTITVNVPTDGSYVLVVTEATPAATTATTPAKPHVHTIALTGTGAQTVTLPRLHTGKFTVQLVKLSGPTTTGEIGTDGKLIAPITVG